MNWKYRIYRKPYHIFYITSLVNGTIELEEFLELITVSRPDNGVDKEEMLSAFQIFDRKRRGYVSIPTLKFILTKVGPTPLTDNVNELLRFADIKGDGKVYYEGIYFCSFNWLFNATVKVNSRAVIESIRWEVRKPTATLLPK